MTTAERQDALYSIYRFKPVKEKSDKTLDDIKLKDPNGKVLAPTDHCIKATQTALSDMNEFKEKKDFQIMLDACNGWMKRKILPDTNMYVNFYFKHT